MEVTWPDEVNRELAELLTREPREHAAIMAAIEKLEACGDRLRAPHLKPVKGVPGTLWELRPRGGHSRYRAFYARHGDEMVIGSIGPEAKVDPQGFRTAVAKATNRLARLKE